MRLPPPSQPFNPNPPPFQRTFQRRIPPLGNPRPVIDKGTARKRTRRVLRGAVVSDGKGQARWARVGGEGGFFGVFQGAEGGGVGSEWG